jgi:uncharacterized protein
MSPDKSGSATATPPDVDVAGQRIPPGERRRIELPAARLATGSAMLIPVEVLHGVRSGPRVWLSAAIHGDELNGIEIIRQVLAESSPRRLAGTLIAVPIVNVFGFMTESRYLPDRRDLNRSFPGSARGSLASRLAHLFMSEVVRGCDYGIDLHTGSADRTNLPQVRADLKDEETRELARAFSAPVAIHAAVRDGSLRAAATSEGARVLVYEGGEARRFNRQAIDVGTAGVLRVLQRLGMRTTAPDPPTGTPPLAWKSAWIRAGRGGLARLDVEPGDGVTKGQPIGVIKDAFGDRILRVRANRTGIVVGLTRQPNVNRGDALVHVAEVEGESTA